MEETRPLPPSRGPTDASGRTPPHPPATVWQAMARILLVADLPLVINAVEAALSGAGSDLTVTSDPAGAAGRALEERVELALVDLQVGSMGGMAVTRSIRAAARTAGVAAPPVALLTDRAADAFLARRAGADGWIRKPFGAFALRDLVARLVTESSGDGTAT